MGGIDCEDYFVGQKPRFNGDFRLGSVLTDPSVVKFIFHRPGDAAPTVWTYGVDAAVVRSATGKYHVDLSLNVAGSWTWRWESTGTVEAAMQGKISVRAESPVG